MKTNDRRRVSGTHDCPGCQRPNIPNRLHACGDCWHRLPRSIQRQITSTVSAPFGLRMEALQAAAEFYASEETR